MVLEQTAQRLALPASGRAWILFGSRKNSKPENYLKTAQNPTCRVHALLARFIAGEVENTERDSYSHDNLATVEANRILQALFES